MKLSVSLSEDDVAFLDRYSVTHAVPSRSAALHQAVTLLRERELADAYTEAWTEWDVEARLWDSTVADGLDSADAAR